MPATQYASRIIKADRRVATASGGHTNYTYPAPADKVSAGLTSLQDCYLQAGAIYTLPAAQGARILVPLAGTLQIGSEQLLAPEQIACFEWAATLQIANPLPHAINYLALTFAGNGADDAVYSIPLQTRNVLQPFPASCPLQGAMGVFGGRTEGTYAACGPTIALIINGAFEVEGRLLEHRDALLLWDADRIEFEALTEFAIIFFFNTSLTL